jgi:nucleotidyltransferase substrate binding protein (TIGR01987 family)
VLDKVGQEPIRSHLANPLGLWHNVIMTIDVSTLQKAISLARAAVAAYEKHSLTDYDEIAIHIRGGAIQAFEFTYELSIKTVKRYLEVHHLTVEQVLGLSFNDLIRKGLEVGILNEELVQWKEFRKNRGTTSHTYDERKATEVYRSIPGFLKEAEFLADRIVLRQKDME